MVGRRAGTLGTRVFGGRYFILANRGTHEEMRALAIRLRKEWKYVRVVRYGRLAQILDDYCCYVFERREL